MVTTDGCPNPGSRYHYRGALSSLDATLIDAVGRLQCGYAFGGALRGPQASMLAGDESVLVLLVVSSLVWEMYTWAMKMSRQ